MNRNLLSSISLQELVILDFIRLGVLNKRLLSMPLEQMSGDLTYAFSDFLGLGSGRFAFEVHRVRKHTIITP